jgi:hypothetical protein
MRRTPPVPWQRILCTFCLFYVGVAAAVLAHLASLLVGSVGCQLWGLHWREEEVFSLQREDSGSLAKLEDLK